MNIYPQKTPESRRMFLQALAAGFGAAALSLPSAVYAAGAGESLQSKINTYVKGLRRSGRVTPDEQTSWSVYDFSTAAKLVSINEEVPRQAASMIKPFVAQAYFYRNQQAPSRYPYSSEVEQLMEAMIRHSANEATNELIRRIGSKPRAERPHEVEQVLRENGGGIFEQVEIVEYIPRNGRTYLNKASARDYSRFLYATWNEQLPGADRMKYLLGLPNADRIRKGTEQVPDVCKILDKTGSTAHLCGNMGIVVARSRDGQLHPYTMIGIIEKANRPAAYGPWIRDRGNVIREVSDLVYAELREQYGLV